MRYVVEYKEDNYDEPEQYHIRDTKHDTVVARIQVGDFTGKVEWNNGTIEARKMVCEKELEAIYMVRLLCEKLEVAAENGEVV